MRARRRSSVLAAALVIAGVIATPVRAAPAWGPQRDVHTWGWSGGSTLAQDASGDLIALVTSDFSQGGFATDHGPFMGVFARTSSDRGATWSDPVRVSQPKRQADRAALAVSGGALYAVWVTQTSYDSYDPSKPRTLYFRANTGGGWGKTIALTKTKGRVDSPSIAASGKHIYVSWVDANTGQVRVARSGNGGKSFVKSVVGKTTSNAPNGEGMAGSSSVGATDNVVGVVWIASGSGAIKARVSTNFGKKWHDAVSIVGSLGSANGGTPSLRGVNGKLSLAWTTPDGVFVRTWSKSWGANVMIAPFGPQASYLGGFDVEIVPAPGGGLGAVWSACKTAGCDALSATTRIDVVWSDSVGGAWSALSVVQGSAHAGQRINESPTAVWLDAGTPVVAYTGRSSGWTSYRVFLRVGS